MGSISVSGVIWGDEGKGKIIDAINSEADVVVKYNGGSNAGATYVIDGKKVALHLLPSGVLRGKRALIAQGAVVNPLRLIKEIEDLDLDIDLGIDPRAHITFPWHIALDIAREIHRGKNAIGTTAQGIGPTYEDKVMRSGVRFHELVGDKDKLEEKIKELYETKRSMLRSVYNSEIFAPLSGEYGARPQLWSLEDVLDRYFDVREKLKPYLTDVSKEVIGLLKEDKTVFFQGSQGFLLDIAFGNYPKVTSSSPSINSIPVYVGVPPHLLGDLRSVGVLKAYVTKVGSGPLVSGLDDGRWPVDEVYSDPIAKVIRQKGYEYGTTTGRARRVGWLDLVVAKYSVEMNGFKEIALTKLDTLADIDPLKVCVAYKADGKITNEYRSWDMAWLEHAEPVYWEISGFSLDDIKQAKTFGDLPDGAKDYISLIEHYLGVPVTLISTGPDRSELIKR